MREDRSLGRAMTMTVRLSGPIQRDKACSEQEAFDRLKAELERAFAAPDNTCHALTAADAIARSGAQSGA